MKLSKISIAYLLVACMLMSFMPVITSAAESTDNYFVSDFEPVAISIPNGGALDKEFALSVMTGSVGAPYFMFTQDSSGAEIAYEEDATKTTALYYAGTDMHLNVGTRTNAWTDFVNDVRLKATYNGETVYIKINSLGTDTHCAWVGFGVTKEAVIKGLGLADDADVASIFTTANVTDFKLVGAPGSGITKEIAVGTPTIATASGARHQYEVRCMSFTTTKFAEAFPEYFYLGTKKTTTASATKAIVGRKADGTTELLATSAGFKDFAFIREVALSGTYTPATGTAYTFDSVPFTSARQSGSMTGAYFKIDEAQLLAQVQAQDNSVTALDSDFAKKLSGLTLVPRKYNTGFFPEGTIYIAPSDFAPVDPNSPGNGGGKVISSIHGGGYNGIYRNIAPLSTIITVEEAGTYQIYAGVYDMNGSRAGVIYVNGTACDLRNTATGWEAYTSQHYYWLPSTVTVTLNKGENVIYFPMSAKTFDATTGSASVGTSFRSMGFAFVPSSATVNATRDKAEEMKSLLDTHNPSGVTADVDVLSYLSSQTHGKPYFGAYADVTVTVNSDAVTVSPGQIYEDAYSKETYNFNNTVNYFTGTPTTLNLTRDGEMIYAPTVLDAMSAAGVDYVSVAAVEVDGKTCDPAVTYIKDGMVITTIATDAVDKTNFAPVLKHDVFYNESTMPTNPNGVRWVGSNNLITSNFSFYVAPTADATVADDTNLIDCKINGYAVLKELGATEVNAYHGATGNFTAGSKTYFMNDSIIKGVYSSAARCDWVSAGTYATGHNSSNPYTYVELDGKKIAHPFGLMYQKTVHSSASTNPDWYDVSHLYITNTASTNDVVANKIKDGEYQLITTGTAIFNVIVTKNGAIQRTLDEQVVTCMDPYTLELNAGEQAYVWNYNPYAGDKTTSGTDMKPLCNVLTY